MAQSPHALSTPRRILAVFYGGFLGTLARYCLSMVIQGWFGKGWPADILLINLSGALLLALVTVLADATFLVGPTRRLLINTGFMGAYTTFSSLALSDVLLFKQGQMLPALLYLALSLLGGLCAILLGERLGRILINGLLGKTTLKQQELAGYIDVQDDLLLSDQVDEIEAAD